VLIQTTMIVILPVMTDSMRQVHSNVDRVVVRMIQVRTPGRRQNEDQEISGARRQPHEPSNQEALRPATG